MKRHALVQAMFLAFAIIFANNDKLAYAVECHVPELSKDQVIAIIQKERARRTDIPREIPNSDKSLYRSERCYYIYKEREKDAIEGGYIFILNESGVIVDILYHHAENHMQCPASDPTLDFLADRLKILRKQEPTLPKPPTITYKTRVVKFGCTFYYSEESDDETISQTFLFDAFGGLNDYMSR